MKVQRSSLSFRWAGAIVALASIAVFTSLWVGNEKGPNDREAGSLVVKKAWNRTEPHEWFYVQRAYPERQVAPDQRLKAADAYRQMRTAARAAALAPEAFLNWQLAGPTNIPGRITDLAVVPGDSSIIYAASAGAGLFKTTDLGHTWIPVFDEVGTYSMGAVAIDPSNPQVVFAGTGEINGRVQTYDGTGLYKSLDGGATWNFAGLSESYGIGRIIVDPGNSQRVFAAVMGRLWGTNPERGVYRSLDGGGSWQRVLYISDSTGCADLALHPATGTLFAAMWERTWSMEDTYTVSEAMVGPNSGLYRSIDGGETWQLLTSPPLPSGPTVGRIGISVDPFSETVYAFYWSHPGNLTGIYRSDNLGETWSATNSAAAVDAVTYRGYYFGQVRVTPGVPDRVYVLGVPMYRSDNGGASWWAVVDASNEVVHVDLHAMYISPTTPDFVIVGTDGGVYTSTTGGLFWTSLQNFPNTQFYTVAIDPHNPGRLYGGTQDNGTLRTPDGSLSQWERILGGDGFYCLVDHTNPNIIYAEWQFGNIAKSINGGVSFSPVRNGINSADRFNWNTPFVMDPSDHSTLYLGTQRLYRTTNGASQWEAVSDDLTDGPAAPGSNVISTIGISPVTPGVIYVGTGDANVWVTRDGGLSWENRSAGLPDRWVTRMTADLVDAAVAYVTLSGYQQAERTSHIYRTVDYGTNWTDIGSGLPDAPVNDVVVDPVSPSTLYIATDFGVYFTDDLGAHWAPLGDGMPLQPVLDLDFNQPTRQLVAATHGRSMYRLYLNCAFGSDTDADGIADECDNCPQTANADQADLDVDGLGDTCDLCPTDNSNDIDGDNLCAEIDNCPLVANPDQADADGDGVGDLCDPCTDTDGDYFGDPGYSGTGSSACPEDNCPDLYNPYDDDTDADGIGDLCDNCPQDFNPGQEDADGDDIGDACEGCCSGRVGDVNGQGGDEPTIGDVSALIDALFILGAPDHLPCLGEADVNQSGGDQPTSDDITIGDISILIDYLFIGGPFDPLSNPDGVRLLPCL